MATTQRSTHQICPLISVDRRLADAFRLWSAARQSYFDPDLFRPNVQSAIQALRSVTWILQKEKSKLAGFDAWYGSKQKLMRENPVLRWLVDARNRIEKQGDLETKSTVRTTIYSGWLDLKTHDVEMPPGLSSALLARSLGKKLGNLTTEDGTIIRVERRWVDSELPNHEILEALTHAYGFLQALLFEAHGLLSTPPIGLCEFHEKLRSSNFVLPDEMLHPFARHQWLDAKSGEPIEIDYGHWSATRQEVFDSATRQYGNDQDYVPSASSNFREECIRYFARGRKIVATDGYHISTAIIEKGIQSQIVQFSPSTRAEKHAYMRDIAEFCERIRAESIMIIGEIWTATVPLKAGAPKFLHAVDAPNRGEALALTGVSRAGECIEVYAPFSRVDEKIVFGPDEVHEGSWPNMTAPFREAFKVAERKAGDGAHVSA